jgi:hypothetical protein
MIRAALSKTARLSAQSFLGVSLLMVFPLSALADWQQDDRSLTWKRGEQIVWRFSFDPDRGKPFFDPVSINDTRLTNFRPEDHPWHYGLWFSWKYINEANYWEENRESGKAQGSTRWSKPQIDRRDDGSATIRLNLTYTHPSGRIDLTETRVLQISAADAAGRYVIDWKSQFVAGEQGAVLDRTPMPNEPKGQINGGYAGLAARLAAAPLTMSVVAPQAAITAFVSDRARPDAPAVAANFSNQGRAVGSLAILAHPENLSQDAPWYVINAEEGMRFLCSAVLAPAARTLPPKGKWDLSYRIVVQAEPFTPSSLQASFVSWQSSEDRVSGTSKL